MGVSPTEVGRIARGPVEAAGVGLLLAPGDVALRCNLATLAGPGPEAEILDRRAGRIREGTEELAAALNTLPAFEGVEGRFRAASQHRCVLRLSGARLSAAITATDPGAGASPACCRPSRPLQAGDFAAAQTARVLNNLLAQAERLLRSHPLNRARVRAGLPPANGLLTRGAGHPQAVGSRAAALGFSGAVVAAERTVLGLARLLGYEPITRPGFTALSDTDVDGKVQAALEALGRHDLVWLHFKGSDTTAHDRNPEGKRDFLERVDRALSPLSAVADLQLAVCADHSTESVGGLHTAEPVPSLLRGAGQIQDDCRVFGERSCRNGGWGRLHAKDLVAAWLAAVRRGTPPAAATYPRARG